MSDVELWVWETFIAEDGHPATRPRPPTDAEILAAAANLDGAREWRCLVGLVHEHFEKRPGTIRCNPDEYFHHRECGWVLVIPLPEQENA